MRMRNGDDDDLSVQQLAGGRDPVFKPVWPVGKDLSGLPRLSEAATDCVP